MDSDINTLAGSFLEQSEGFDKAVTMTALVTALAYLIAISVDEDQTASAVQTTHDQLGPIIHEFRQNIRSLRD